MTGSKEVLFSRQLCSVKIKVQISVSLLLFSAKTPVMLVAKRPALRKSNVSTSGPGFIKSHTEEGV